MKQKKLAFTFVELIVVISIIAILSSIGFYAYVGYLSESRDSQRKSDLSQVTSALKIYKQKRGYYAFPGNTFDIVYSGTTVATQGKLNKNVHLNSLETLPTDPKIDIYYGYSITSNKQEFELGATLENEDINISIVSGNYKSVSANILPTLLIATGALDGDTVNIKETTTAGDVHRKLFVYDKQSHNLLYQFSEPYEPYSDGTSFTGLLDEVKSKDTYWQNSDFRNCLEISEGGKLLLPLSSTSFEYQIVTDTGALVNTGCTL